MTSAVYEASDYRTSKSTWTSTYPNTISHLNGYDDDAVTYYPVVIIGAGESGIAMGCRLKEVLGFDQFRIFDRQGGVGGTWWINRYPGVACDVPAIFYSFSFSPNHNWSSFHPPGPEIVKYLSDVCSKYEITDKIQCDTDVKGCRWLEDEEIWEVYLVHMMPGTGDLSAKDRNAKMEKDGEQSVYLKRETIRAKVVVSAVGGLVEPKTWPENIKGSESFEGEIFHSARWNYDVNFNDKDVIVLGTGCRAAQLVPRLTKAPFNAKSVTQIMRSPPWTAPRDVPPFGPEKWAKYSPIVLNTVPLLGKTLRALIHFVTEYDHIRWFQNDEAWNRREREKAEKQLLDYLYKTTPQKYHEILTPNYALGCKRRIFDHQWLQSLNDPRIDLTTQPLTKVNPRSVTIGPGRTYPEGGPDVLSDEHEIPADVIVLANGFDTTKWLHPLKVLGEHGKDLVEEMDARGGPQAYQGTAMDGFPNFFMIFGPSTATGHSSVILASENMVNYSLKFIKQILDGDVHTFDVKREAEEAYTTDIQRALKPSVFMSGGCASWYFDRNGWNSTLMPYTQTWFALRCMFPIWSDWNIKYTRKGIFKHRSKQVLRTLVATMIMIGAFQARRSGQGLAYFKARFASAGTYLNILGKRYL